jgi:membrane protein implicated in regulation of membrane protease activity
MFNFTNRSKAGLCHQTQRVSNRMISSAATRLVKAREGNEAIVTQTIAPGRKGQVKYQGSWWTARCHDNVTLMVGTMVYVMSRQNLTLYIERMF